MMWHSARLPEPKEAGNSQLNPHGCWWNLVKSPWLLENGLLRTPQNIHFVGEVSRFLLRHLGSGPVFSAPLSHQTLQQASKRAARERCMQQRKERHRHEKYAVTQITQKLLKYHQCCHCLHNLGLLSWDKTNSCRYVQLWPQTLRTAAFKRDSSFGCKIWFRSSSDVQATRLCSFCATKESIRKSFTNNHPLYLTYKASSWSWEKSDGAAPKGTRQHWGRSTAASCLQRSPQQQGSSCSPWVPASLVRGIWVFDGK